MPNTVGKPYAVLDVFKALTEKEMQLVRENQVQRTYRKGEIVYKEGSKILGIYQVTEGAFKIYKTGVDEKPQIIAFTIPGDIQGYRSVLSNEPACTTVEALQESKITFIPAEIIFYLVKNNPDFALLLIQQTCKELDRANSLITDIAQKKVNERVAEILLMLLDTFGTDREGFINVNLTRDDLSNIIGTATESVIRILRDFNSKDYIELKNKKIKINDYKRIKLISESI